MDINQLLTAWNRFFRDRCNYMRHGNQNSQSESSETAYEAHEDRKKIGNIEHSPDGGFEVESHAPENPETGADYGADDAPGGDDSPDHSEPEDSASHNVSDTNNDNGSFRRFQAFSIHARDYATTQAKVAVAKVKTTILQVRNSLLSSIEVLRQKSAIQAAKDLSNWISEHPWETALVVVPLVVTAGAAITLLAVGFGPGGIVAGSAAAAIQAGIGNVVAHSLFATCTSAMMGGYGAAVIFGGTWALSTVAMAAAKKSWKWWNSPNERRLVRMQTVPTMTVFQSLDRAADTFIFSSAVVAGLVVYYVRSWMQTRKPRPDDETPLLS